MKMFKCFSARVAGTLIRQGFELKGKATNSKFPQYDVFLFENTKEFREAFIKAQEKNNK